MAKKMSPTEKAARTDRWTEILFKALASRVARRWRFISFRGVGGREWKGVVDVLAVRKDTSKSSHEVLMTGDLFDMILIQMKGGGARKPSPADVKRLVAVKKHYSARQIVLFSWRKGSGCTWKTWDGNEWETTTPRAIFGS